jgi:hypothetical protein
MVSRGFCPRPYLEAGVDSGRFARAPGIEYGVPGIQTQDPDRIVTGSLAWREYSGSR